MARLSAPVDAVRRFNRFYTQRIGVLHEGLLESPFSLAEVRVLYELAHRESPTATELASALEIDPGYLSRILRGFVARGLVARKSSAADGRQSLLRLSAKGRAAFRPLEARSNAEVAAMLRALPRDGQGRLLQAMRTIESLLDTAREQNPAYVLRFLQPGDIGWVVHRHGVLYAEEEGYDERFEALVAGIVSAFIEKYDPRRERCWIAEREGEIVGSVFLVKKSKTIAKLRLLLVEPSARGLGIGRRLIEECVRFARHAGYRKLTLWTQKDLHAARHLYKRAGFRRTSAHAHHSFSRHLVAETWDLDL